MLRGILHNAGIPHLNPVLGALIGVCCIFLWPFRSPCEILPLFTGQSQESDTGRLVAHGPLAESPPECRDNVRSEEGSGASGFYLRLDFGINRIQNVEARFGTDTVKEATGYDRDWDIDDLYEVDENDEVEIGNTTLDVNETIDSLSKAFDDLDGKDLFRIGIYSESGMRFGLGFGYRFKDWLSIELETGLLYNPIALQAKIAGLAVLSIEGNYFQLPLLLNAIAEIPMSREFRPYLGAGAGGVAFFLSGAEVFQGKGVIFAFQATGGFRYAISQSVSFNLGYKFLMTPGLVELAVDTDYWEMRGVDIDKSVMNHTGSLGVTVVF